MSIFNSLLSHSQVKTSHSLYPKFKPHHNFFVKTAGNLIFYFIGLIPLPIKLLLRENFGFRYFSLLDYILYLALITYGAGFLFLWTIVMPTFLISNGFEGVIPTIKWLIHMPCLSILFLFWITFKLWRQFNSERNRPLDKVPNHGYYPGDSKLIGNNSVSDKYKVSKNIREKIEPNLCMTFGFLLFPLDYLLGVYFIVMAACLRIEIWHENMERKNAVIDLIDTLIDGRYQAWMFEKFQKCEELNLPLEEVYKELISINEEELHENFRNDIPNEIHFPEVDDSFLGQLKLNKILKDLI